MNIVRRNFEISEAALLRILCAILLEDGSTRGAMLVYRFFAMKPDGYMFRHNNIALSIGVTPVTLRLSLRLLERLGYVDIKQSPAGGTFYAVVFNEAPVSEYIKPNLKRGKN